jgi:hypothetical protein
LWKPMLEMIEFDLDGRLGVLSLQHQSIPSRSPVGSLPL